MAKRAPEQIDPRSSKSRNAESTDAPAAATEVLLLGNYRPSLGIARSLRADGYRVIAGPEAFDWDSECMHSRFVAMRWRPRGQPSSGSLLWRELVDFCASRSTVAAVFPVAEEYVRYFAERARYFHELPDIVIVDPKTVLTCLNKQSMFDLARRCDVPVARFEELCLDKETKPALEHFRFPVVVRHLSATELLDGKKVLKFRLRELLPDGAKLLVQERFDGDRFNVYFAARDGLLVETVCARITRTDRPDGSGLAVEGTTVTPSAGDTTRVVLRPRRQ